MRYLPQSKFSKLELRMFPREVAQLADELISQAKAGVTSKLPSGFEPPEHR